MKVVNEIKEQFTLADVLPSSLDISERDAGSYNNGSVANSRNMSCIDAKKLVPIEKTIDEDRNDVLLIDEEEQDEKMYQHSAQCAANEVI